MLQPPFSNTRNEMRRTYINKIRFGITCEMYTQLVPELNQPPCMNTYATVEVNIHSSLIFNNKKWSASHSGWARKEPLVFTQYGAKWAPEHVMNAVAKRKGITELQFSGHPAQNVVNIIDWPMLNPYKSKRNDKRMTSSTDSYRPY